MEPYIRLLTDYLIACNIEYSSVFNDKKNAGRMRQSWTHIFGSVN